MNTGHRQESHKVHIYYVPRDCTHAKEYVIDATRDEINDEILDIATTPKECLICAVLGDSTTSTSGKFNSIWIKNEDFEEVTIGMMIRRGIRIEDWKNAKS